MPVSAIIFDLDGTLLDTLDDIAAAANEVLQSIGCGTYPVPSYRTFVGNGVRMLFRRALSEEQKTDELVERCAERFREVYGGSWSRRSRPYEGIDQLLEDLRQRGFPLAVLSNKPHEFTEKCIQHFFPALRFQSVLGHRTGVPLKPDPASALEIARQLALPPGECLFVGDSSIDMLTARAAGMLPVGALWGFRNRRELEESGAVALIEKPGELLRVLAQLES